jgi:hypothetical protein
MSPLTLYFDLGSHLKKHCSPPPQARAASEKEKGNKAFVDKDYEKAIEHFTTCIELEPE